MGHNGSTIKVERRNLTQKRKVLILTVLSGEDIGREYVLSKAETIIGRDEDSDIVIKDPLISRHHTRLEIKRPPQGVEEIVLTDLDSANGTFLNYEPVSRAVLKDGDKIMVGATILKLAHKDIYDQQLLDDLIKIATVDDLTGLYNKRQIITLGEEEFARAQRYRRPFSLMVLEIDALDDLAATYAPATKDTVLKRLGGTILATLRQQDKAGRYGRAEFLILLPEARTADARVVAERLGEQVQTLQFSRPGGHFGITVSLGITSRAECKSESFVHMVERADQALYLAKQNGKGLLAVREGTPDPDSDLDLEERPPQKLV